MYSVEVLTPSHCHSQTYTVTDMPGVGGVVHMESCSKLPDLTMGTINTVPGLGVLHD